MKVSESVKYPAHMHQLCPLLTLQGIIAHVDMPLETGPARYLPHSQKYEHGYLAFHQREFQMYFEEAHIQLPLRKGDAVFFSPALLYSEGANTTQDVQRMANLLQVNCAFGRSMEYVNRTKMCLSLFEELVK